MLKEYLIFIGQIISVFAVIGFFWALTWVLCLASDHCYNINFPGIIS